MSAKKKQPVKDLTGDAWMAGIAPFSEARRPEQDWKMGWPQTARALSGNGGQQKLMVEAGLWPSAPYATDDSDIAICGDDVLLTVEEGQLAEGRSQIMRITEAPKEQLPYSFFLVGYTGSEKEKRWETPRMCILSTRARAYPQPDYRASEIWSLRELGGKLLEERIKQGYPIKKTMEEFGYICELMYGGYRARESIRPETMEVLDKIAAEAYAAAGPAEKRRIRKTFIEAEEQRTTAVYNLYVPKGIMEGVMTMVKAGWFPMVPMWSGTKGYVVNQGWDRPCGMRMTWSKDGMPYAAANNIENKLSHGYFSGFTLHVPSGTNTYDGAVHPEWEALFREVCMEVAATEVPASRESQMMWLLEACRRIPLVVTPSSKTNKPFTVLVSNGGEGMKWTPCTPSGKPLEEPKEVKVIKVDPTTGAIPNGGNAPKTRLDEILADIPDDDEDEDDGEDWVDEDEEEEEEEEEAEVEA